MSSAAETPDASGASPTAELGFRLPGLNNKFVRFAVLGGAGCLLGALLGEIWLLLFRLGGPDRPPHMVCLVMDCSSSMLHGEVPWEMSGQKLREMKTAASDFVGRQDLATDMISVVAFSSGSHVAAPLSHSKEQLQSSLGGLQARGSTEMDRGLNTATAELRNLPPELQGGQVLRSVLLFTDGQPDDPHRTRSAALACREAGIRIVAIGTGDADVQYLQELTGDPALVFPARSGNFAESFKQAEAALYSGSLVESSGSGAGFFKSLLQILGWTALLACGVSLFLIGGQNHYLHRGLLTSREAMIGLLGGAGAGLVAGLAGQLLFVLATAAAPGPGSTIGSILGSLMVGFGRIVGWAILGALVARGLAFFVPNLEPRRAWLGGAAGGAIAAVAFLIAALLGDVLGRLLGAAILGAIIGMLIAIIEAAFRQAWLEVRYGAKEMISVSLGATPVKIGSDNRACTVYARGARPLAMQYKLEDGKVHCLDYSTEKWSVLPDGDEKAVGHVMVTVRASRSAAPSGAGAGASAGMATRAVPPPPPAKAELPPAPNKPAIAPASKPAVPPKAPTPARDPGIKAPPPPKKPN